MDTFAALAHGMAVAMQPMNLLYALIGVFLGTAVGVLPGIGPALTVALLLPVTYKLDPALQAAHAAHPWVLTWDDHEVDNDYAGDRDERDAEHRVIEDLALAQRQRMLWRGHGHRVHLGDHRCGRCVHCDRHLSVCVRHACLHFWPALPELLLYRQTSA